MQQCYMTRGVQAWAKKHGTERIVEEMHLLAMRHSGILRESITFWAVTKEPDLTIRIAVDDGDSGKGRVVLLDLIDKARILVAPARALPQRFFMSIDTENSVTNLTLMLPEDY